MALGLRPRSFAFPLTILSIGLATTALVAVQAQRTAAARDEERFEVAVDRLDDSIKERIDLYVAMLRAGAGLLAAGGIESPEQFRVFAERLQLSERYPGVQGIGYTERLNQADLTRFVSERRRRGQPGFHVWPEGDRAEYHAVLFLEPLDRRNRAAIGYDMSTDPTRRAAMERARDTGAPAASGLVTLVQEIDEAKQPGFLIYMPLYAGSTAPTTVEERRRSLRGFVYSPFRAGDLFAGILGRNPRSRAGVSLFDGAPGTGALIHRTPVDDASGRLRTTRTIEVAGRSWTAEVFSTAALERSSTRPLIGLIAWGGAAITLLLSGLATLQTRARARAEQSESEAADAYRRFELLANTIPQLAWMAKPDGWIYWYNDRWYDYTGTRPEQMRGWGWQAVHDPDELPEVVARWKQSISTGEPFEMEFPLRSADGSYRWFLTRVAPFRDSRGTIVQWFGTNTDVQYRRDTERSLREQAETLDILNRTGAQLAGELDQDRLVQAITDAATRLTRAQFGAFFHNSTDDQGESYTLYTISGVPREAFASFPMPRNTAVFGPTFRGEAILRSADITADPRYGRNPPYHGLPPGHLPVRSYLAAPVKSRSGEVIGGLFFGHAECGVFTEQAEEIVAGIASQAAIALDNARLYGQVQDLLARERGARAEAERVSRLKDEFLATLSHELRTPLNAVVGWAHLLHSGRLGESQRRTALETILRNARMQSQLIEELLDMSRIISGRVSIDLSVVNLQEVVSAALDAVRPTAIARRIELVADFEPRTLHVRGDNRRLQQVVWNLLTNAVKFTPPGGRVSVVGRRSDEVVQLTVRDTGIGISAEFLPHVFERFRQADGSMSRGHGGLGLGLSIVQGLVEMHGGTIHAASAGPDCGATFTLQLPAAAAPERLAPLPQKDAEPGAHVLRGRSILIVDDEADSAALAAEVLRQSGATVVVTTSADEALRRLHSDRAAVDVIVSDLGMPNVDGYELIRRVRALAPELGGSALAVALTAYAGPEDEARALTAGYDVHLAKPFTPDELLKACAALVEAHPRPSRA